MRHDAVTLAQEEIGTRVASVLIRCYRALLAGLVFPAPLAVCVGRGRTR
ncbi:hypothetical protein [Shimia aestuarii]|uniref:Uncharacterized protein n=1 Tax=Shimia aestuarii TaxID=254406 RepID=A0A1I4PZJ7_9RHOB|nr:hypothetical protein [Shimia aestuarii]SFM32833.1 hypothetical protein SAMN04488042_106105 [Shimia aestuarii]